MKKANSIEEQIEDLAKKQLGDTKYYTKTEAINTEIESALKAAPSKSGGKGPNFPDIKLLIETVAFRRIPVMIECKGTAGFLIKADENGTILNLTKSGTPNYTNIEKYAVNGAVHYANAIVEHTNTFKEVIAVGVNGYYENNSITFEAKAYYISLKNNNIPKFIGDFSDISFLKNENISQLIEKIDNLMLTDEELEEQTKKIENDIEDKLKKLNQIMHDDLEIPVGFRVSLIAGMIMAGLGIEGKVSPLEITDLKAETGKEANDGYVIINKIKSFLAERELPEEKKNLIINELSKAFIHSNLSTPTKKGESKLKIVYSYLKTNILSYFYSSHQIDFTGKLFNVLNDWVDVPDGAENDVVLTPRYVTEFMAKLCQVNRNSYVWDYAVGTAGFLISSMKLMIKDAELNEGSPDAIKRKITEIKTTQLLGIEKLPDIYLLAVLNMILMGDGSSNIIQADSLTDYSGNYEQGKLKGVKYPANVFLLNPPYSAAGKGFVFVKKALAKMQNGKAAVLIQENAGSGNGLPYTKDI